MSLSRVDAAVEASGWVTVEEATDVLAADDARAREAGLVCAGDGLTVEWLAQVVRVLRFTRQALRGSASLDADRALSAVPAELRSRIEQVADHPHVDPGDGRRQCQTCDKWVYAVTHSCKGIPVTGAAPERPGA
jgi:hypothetical protein